MADLRQKEYGGQKISLDALINSLTPRRSDNDFKGIISELILGIKPMSAQFCVAIWRDEARICTWHPAGHFELYHLDGLVQNCSNSIANALELLQSCTKPSIWSLIQSNTVLMRSNITGYSVQHCSDSSSTEIRVYTHKGHHIARPHWGAMECDHVYFINWLHYNCTAL